MIFCSTIFIIVEYSRNIGSGVRLEICALLITVKLELICTLRQLLQELYFNIMFSNYVIEMNAVVFSYFRNTVLSTAILIQRAHQMIWSAYIEACINAGTYNLHHYFDMPIKHDFTISCLHVNVIRNKESR